MEFKNLAEVTKLEAVPEGASVLAATAEGEVVRVPGDSLGGGGAGWQFVVNIELSGEGNYTETDTGWSAGYGSDDGGAVCDKTFEEIKSAFESGLVPVVVARQKYEGSGTSVYIASLLCEEIDGDNSSYEFGNIYGDEFYANYVQVLIYHDYCVVNMGGREY